MMKSWAVVLFFISSVGSADNLLCSGGSKSFDGTADFHGALLVSQDAEGTAIKLKVKNGYSGKVISAESGNYISMDCNASTMRHSDGYNKPSKIQVSCFSNDPNTGKTDHLIKMYYRIPALGGGSKVTDFDIVVDNPATFGTQLDTEFSCKYLDAVSANQQFDLQLQ